MPTVPYVPAPQVQPLPMPRLRKEPQLSPNAPTEAFGAGVASQAGGLGNLQGAQGAFEQIADRAQRVRLEEKARAGSIAVTDAGGQIADVHNKLWSQYQNELGKNSFDLPERASKDFWDAQQVIEDGLSNPDQKAAAHRIGVSEWTQLNGRIQSHVAQQRKVYDNQSTQAALDAQHDKAVQSYDDPSVVEPAIAARATIIEQHGQRNGLPDEFTKEQVAQATSSTRLDVLKQFVDNRQDVQAKAYLDKYKSDFVPKDLPTAETLVSHSSVEGEAQRQADTITLTSPTLMGALGEAQKIDDPNVRDKAEQRIRRHFEDVEAARRQDREQAFDRAGQIVEKTGDYDKVPMSVRLKMSTEQNAALQRREKQIRTGDEPGDSEQYLTLLNEAYFNPDQFSQEQILSAKGLSASQKTHLMTLQRSVGAKGERQDEADIQHRITRADQDARYYQRKAENATNSGDEENAKHFAEQQKDAETERDAAKAELDARRTAGPGHAAPPTPVHAQGNGVVIRGAPVVGSGSPHVPAATQTGAPAPSAPAGLNIAPSAPPPKVKATQQMLDDIAKKGPAYAEYLRKMNVDVPDVLPLPEKVLPPEPKKKGNE